MTAPRTLMGSALRKLSEQQGNTLNNQNQAEAGTRFGDRSGKATQALQRISGGVDAGESWLFLI